MVQIDVSYTKTKRLESVLDLNTIQLRSSPLFHDKQIFNRILTKSFLCNVTLIVDVQVVECISKCAMIKEREIYNNL